MQVGNRKAVGIRPPNLAPRSDHLYGGMDKPELKIIDVFVCKLRKKLAQATSGSHYIETVWGRGYVLRDPAITSRNCCG